MTRRGRRPPRLVDHDWHAFAWLLATLVGLAVVILAIGGLWTLR